MKLLIISNQIGQRVFESNCGRLCGYTRTSGQRDCYRVRRIYGDADNLRYVLATEIRSQH